MKSMCIAIHSTLSLNVYLHSKQNLVGFYCLGFNDSKYWIVFSKSTSVLFFFRFQMREWPCLKISLDRVMIINF